jgi:hypothetical protein
MWPLILEDPTFPIVHFGFYHIETHARKWGYYGKVNFVQNFMLFFFFINSQNFLQTSFMLQNYLDGIDQRVEVIKDHIRDCISTYGASRVLL